MMRSGVSLNVAGVRPETVAAAREAARRSGVSLGQWLSSAIIETAADDGVPPPPRQVSRSHPGPDQESSPREHRSPGVNEQLDELADRLEALMTPKSRGPGPGAGEPTGDDIRPSLRAIEARLSSMARDLIPASQATTQRLADVIADLNARLDQLILARPMSDDLEQRIAAVRSALSSLDDARAAEPEDSSDGLDEAIAEISARQQALDLGMNASEASLTDPSPDDRADEVAAPPATPDLSRLEEQLRIMTEQIETLRRPAGVEDAVNGLRRELADIGRKLNEALPRDLLEGFQTELHSLAERIEMGAQRGVDGRALASVERGLEEIRETLSALAPAESIAGFGEDLKALSRKIEFVGAAGPDPGTIHHLEDAIAELRGLTDRVASGEALSALASEIRTIGAHFEQFVAAEERATDVGQIEQLSKRIEGIAASIEARVVEPEAAVPAHMESLIRTLTDKLEATRSWGDDHVAFEQLESRIIALAQKLDASDARLGNLSAIEQSISGLILQLKEARAAAIEAAEAAARSVAHEMLTATAGAGDVDALRHDVAELRTTQADIDRRTASALEAVHDTLERLVERLASIEAEMSASPRAPLMPQSEPPGARNGSRDAASAGAGRSPFDAVPSAAMSSVISRRLVETSLPDDHPLEPGSGSPRRLPASPAERIAASEAALAAARPQGPEPSAKANFIAAARRAAQAAAESSEGSSGDEADSGRSGLNAIGHTLAKRRRPLLIAITVLVVGIGAVRLLTGMFGSNEQVRGDPQHSGSDVTTAPAQDPGKPDAPAAAPPEASPPGPDASPASQPNGAVAPGRRSQATPDDGTLLSPIPTATIAVPNLATGRHNAAPAIVAPPASSGPGPDATGAIPQLQTNPAPAGLTLRSATAQPTPDKLPASIGDPALRMAAAAADPAAEFEVALRYSEGRGVPQSFEDAARWFERAAKNGLAPAQYRLGSLYEKGQGVKKDLEAARRLYLAAAAKGNGKAMHNLAVLFAEGIDGDPDYKSASQWFRKAADHGISDSQYNLAILYARGIGIEQNLSESYKWFALAAQQGDQDAAKKRDEVAARLDAQSLAAARLAVQTFTADPQPDDAINVKAPPGGWERAGPAKPKLSAPGHAGPT